MQILSTLVLVATAATASAPEERVELNTATYEEIAALPGVGEAFAPRIIEGRPYTATHQLLSRRIVPRATYDRIKNRVAADEEPERLALAARSPRPAS